MKKRERIKELERENIELRFGQDVEFESLTICFSDRSVSWDDGRRIEHVGSDCLVIPIEKIRRRMHV